MGSWLLGIALGGLTGALLLVNQPACVGAHGAVVLVGDIRDRRRPLGLGGLLVGFGGGMIGLVWSRERTLCCVERLRPRLRLHL